MFIQLIRLPICISFAEVMTPVIPYILEDNHTYASRPLATPFDPPPPWIVLLIRSCGVLDSSCKHKIADSGGLGPIEGTLCVSNS